MQLHQFAPILGLSAVTLVSLPIQAQAATFQIESGVTSVFLDLPLLESAAGLVLTGTDGTVAPAAGPFQVGFTITDEADFTFSDEAGFTLLGGTIEHTGTITFNNSVTVGDFSIGFNADRADGTTGASGFFVQDTATLGAILFDLTNVVPTLADPAVAINGDLLVSPEFAAFLGNDALTGAAVGSAQTNATVAAPTDVPEPVSLISLLTLGGVLVAHRRRFSPLST
ncbi:MAG: PEP-CTERM sorting domain-containing protein [Almyronema sp.]